MNAFGKPALRILREAGVVIENGHFVYTQGGHGSVYVAKDRLYTDPDRADHIGELFASTVLVHAGGTTFDTVVAPATAGVWLSHSVGKHIRSKTNAPIRCVWADKHDDGFVITRGFKEHVEGKRVVCLEDVTNSGTSLARLIGAVRDAGGTVVGAATIVNRGPSASDSLGIGFFASLVEISADAWYPSRGQHCPLCAQGIPIDTEHGYGRKYLQNA